MKDFKTLLLASLVGGLCTTVLADLSNVQTLTIEQELIQELKFANETVPPVLYEIVYSQLGITPPDLNDVNRQGGDDIGAAVLITELPFLEIGTTDGYTDDYDEVCDYTGSLSPDVVYSYTPTVDKIVDLSLCNSGYDTKLYIYENSYTPGAPFACNDDYCPGYMSFIGDLTLTGGNTYYIVVDGYDGEFGAYELEITATWTECFVECAGAVMEGEGYFPPAEDTVNGGCNSDPVVFGQISCGDICGSMFTYVPVGGGNFRDTDWYEFILPMTTTVSFDAFSCNSDYKMYVLWYPVETCINYQILAQTQGNENDKNITVTLDPGTYYLWVGPSLFEGMAEETDYSVRMWADYCDDVAEVIQSPLAFNLKQNYPNPFNPITSIDFSLDLTSMVRLNIFSINGEKVANLIDNLLEEGSHSASFDAGNLPSGVYFYTLEADGFTDTKKMVLMK
jgi:hypothetical protein